MKSFIINGNNITKFYGKNVVLQNLNINIKKGSITGLIGQNGVGKTTLLNILTNCIKNYSGDVNILGKKIKNDNLIRNNIGYMPEKNDLLLNMKLIDIYLYSARINNVKKVEAIHRIDIILKWLNLEKWSNIELKKFSSGMRQKAYLGRCLIHNPEILILDEPTSKLDPLFRKDILNILIQLNKQGKTLLIYSHDLKN